MKKRIIDTNKYLNSKNKRKREILQSQLSSFKLEDIKISREKALKIAEKVESKFK